MTRTVYVVREGKVVEKVHAHPMGVEALITYPGTQVWDETSRVIIEDAGRRLAEVMQANDLMRPRRP